MNILNKENMRKVTPAAVVKGLINKTTCIIYINNKNIITFYKHRLWAIDIVNSSNGSLII